MALKNLVRITKVIWHKQHLAKDAKSGAIIGLKIMMNQHRITTIVAILTRQMAVYGVIPSIRNGNTVLKLKVFLDKAYSNSKYKVLYIVLEDIVQRVFDDISFSKTFSCKRHRVDS